MLLCFLVLCMLLCLVGLLCVVRVCGVCLLLYFVLQCSGVLFVCVCVSFRCVEFVVVLVRSVVFVVVGDVCCCVLLYVVRSCGLCWCGVWYVCCLCWCSWLFCVVL